MLDIKNNKTILLLDAGGTNFVFTAIKSGKEIVEPITKASNAHDLNLCFKSIVDGFQEVINHLDEKPSAISFAFPGPADYPMGIIGDLPNLPAFRGGVPLGPMLEEHFKIPVFINNDGDLYAYGEAIAGILPKINAELEAAGSVKRYKNLVGITLGTGFGAGIVINGELLIGDNSTAAEVWITSNRNHPEANSEEGVSTRAIQNAYYQYTTLKGEKNLMPKDIYDIAKGEITGDKEAAIKAFETFGSSLGDTIANLLTLIDGIVVIGGGLSGARDLFMPAVLKEIREHSFKQKSGELLPRLVQKVYDFNNESDKEQFLSNKDKELTVPGTTWKLKYNPTPKLAVATTEIGANKAIALGAYAFALKNLL